MQDDVIKHTGIISEINKDLIKVSIIAQSACSACHAKGVCSVSDMQEKFIDVKNNGNFDQKVGDFVTVSMKQKLGLKAVLFGYFIPFVLLMITLIIALGYFENEGIAGLTALGILAPYYLFLYLLKDRLRESFEFQIEKNIATTNFNFNTSEK